MKLQKKILLSLVIFSFLFLIFYPLNQVNASTPYDRLYVEYEGIYGEYNETLDAYIGESVQLIINYTFWKSEWYNFTLVGSGAFQGEMTGSVCLENRSMYYIVSSLNLTFSEGNHMPFFLIPPISQSSSFDIAINDTDLEYDVVGATGINRMGKNFQCWVLWHDDTSSVSYFDENTLILIQAVWNVDPIIDTYLYIYVTDWNIPEVQPFKLDPIWWLVIIATIILGIVVGARTIFRRIRPKAPPTKMKKPVKLVKKKAKPKPTKLPKFLVTLKKYTLGNKWVRRGLLVGGISLAIFIFALVWDAMFIGDWLPTRFGTHDPSGIEFFDGDIGGLYYVDGNYVIYNGSDNTFDIWVEIPYIDLHRDYDFTLTLQYTGYDGNKIQSIDVYAHNTSDPWFGFIDTKCYGYHRIVDGDIANKSTYTMRFNMRTDYINSPTNVGSFEGRYDTLPGGGHGFTFLIEFTFINSGESLLKIDQCVLTDEGNLINPLA